MKKLLFVVALMLTSLSVNAQGSNWTVEAGVGFSSLVGDDTKGDKSLFSYKVGVTYDLALAENFYIIPGLELVNKGFKEDGITGNINMFYAQIPVLVAYKFPIADEIKLAIKAGPYASYGVLGSDIQYTGSKKVNVFDSSMFDRFNWGAKAGISVDFDQFSIGFEYSRGFKKLNSKVDAYHQVIAAVFGFKF